MRNMSNLIGILLVVFGLLGLGYQTFSYNQREKVAEIGDVQITTDQEKNIHVPPIISGGALAVGIALLLLGRKR